MMSTNFFAENDWLQFSLFRGMILSIANSRDRTTLVNPYCYDYQFGVQVRANYGINYLPNNANFRLINVSATRKSLWYFLEEKSFCSLTPRGTTTLLLAASSAASRASAAGIGKRGRLKKSKTTYVVVKHIYSYFKENYFYQKTLGETLKFKLKPN